MFSRQAVVDRWQRCLAEAESASAGPASRLNFYYRMRVRLYRFLLACYGSGDWQADEAAEDDDAGQPSSAMPLVEEGGHWEGKPPKGGDSIRTALERIHAGNEGAASAASVPTTEQPMWVAATAQSAGISPRRCCSLLRGRGTQARLVRRGDDVIVEVPRDDLDTALRLIAQRIEYLSREHGHRAHYRIRSQPVWPTIVSCLRDLATAGGIMALGLAIMLAWSYAAGESTWDDLRPWCVILLVAAAPYAGFRLWSIFRKRRRGNSRLD
jgi:hypothetical protein